MDKTRTLRAIELMGQGGSLDDEQLAAKLEGQDYTSTEAALLIALVPIAFGRPVLEKLGVTNFDQYVSVPTRAGRWVRLPLSQFPVFVHALELAREHGRSGILDHEAYKSLAVRGPEIDAANRALNEGADIKGARVSSALIGPCAEDLGYGSLLARLRARFSHWMSSSIRR